LGLEISYKNLLIFFYLVLFVFVPRQSSVAREITFFQDTVRSDNTGKSILRLHDVPSNIFDAKQSSPLFLNNPSNIKSTVIYDAEKNEYIVYQKVGDLDYRTPVHMSPEEYRKYEFDKSMRDYWSSRIAGDENGYRSSLIPQIEFGGEAFDKIF
jgi:hypothetical protein